MARILVRPESADAARALLVALATETRHESGCIDYRLFQRADAPHEFRTVEQWHDAVAADAHMGTPHVAAAIAAATPMLTAPPEILRFEPLG